jgi:hypothetical protein
MKHFSQLFNDVMRLMVGTNSKSFCGYKNFFHVQSFFNDEWYNFIIPKCQNPAGLDMNKINKLIEKESAQGKKVSFYINQTLLDKYKSFLDKNKYSLCGNEVYIQKTINAASGVKLPEGYTIDNSYELEKVIKILEECFPEWSTERDYSKAYENYKKQGQEGRGFETFVVHLSDEIIGAASVFFDKKLNLSYLHNDGILEPHRRKGLHTALIDTRNNFCVNNGVTRIASIVEDGSGSYVSFLKNGFEVADKFFIFTKSF